MRAWLPPDASFVDFMLPLLLQGVAMSCYFLAMLTILLDGIPPHQIPSASGISNFARITAGGFAASVTTTLWDRREALHQSRLTDVTTAFNPVFHRAVGGLAAHGLSHIQGDALVGRLITSQAYLMSAEDMFWISGWLSLLMIGMVWLARRAVAGGAVVAAD